ncbi:MAG: (2Fe-2S)-binding protein [Phycisphaeraceae bacterium]
MRIDRCLCTGQAFADLLDRARQAGWSLDELAERTGATRGCGLCRPYLREGLATGQAVFTQVMREGRSRSTA